MALSSFHLGPKICEKSTKNRSKIDQKIDQFFDVTLVSFLVRLGSLLASLLGPLGRPNRPKIGPSRLLTADFCQTRDFSRNAVSPRRNPILRPQDVTQDDPRSIQDGSKTILMIFFFRLRFYLRFWSVLGPIWAPCWLRLGPLLGLKTGPSRVPSPPC